MFPINNRSYTVEPYIVLVEKYGSFVALQSVSDGIFVGMDGSRSVGITCQFVERVISIRGDLSSVF